AGAPSKMIFFRSRMPFGRHYRFLPSSVPRLVSISVRSNDLPCLDVDEDVDLAATCLDLDHVDILAALSLNCYVSYFSGHSLKCDLFGVRNRDLRRRRLLLRGLVAQLSDARNVGSGIAGWERVGNDELAVGSVANE